MPLIYLYHIISSSSSIVNHTILGVCDNIGYRYSIFKRESMGLEQLLQSQLLDSVSSIDSSKLGCVCPKYSPLRHTQLFRLQDSFTPIGGR